MTNIIDNVGYTYIEYSTAFHMKYKQLSINTIYDEASVAEYPLVITWAEAGMKIEEQSGKPLAVAAKTSYYLDTFRVSEDTFENMLQAFIIFPDSNDEEEEYSSKLRLELVKALLNS